MTTELECFKKALRESIAKRRIVIAQENVYSDVDLGQKEGKLFMLEELEEDLEVI